jgi:hypothetical protein
MWGKAYKYFPVKPVFLLSIFIFEVGSLICGKWSIRHTLMCCPLNIPSCCAEQRHFHRRSGHNWSRLRRHILRMLHCHNAILETATSTGYDQFSVRDLCSCLGGRTFDWGSVYAERDMAMVVSWRNSHFQSGHPEADLDSFYINLPFGGIAALAMLLAFRAPKASAPTPASAREKFLQMDLPGAILVCAAIVCFTLALRWAGIEKSWNDSEVIGTLVGAGIFLILFGVDQWYQGERALIMPSFLKNRILLVGAIFEFL